MATMQARIATLITAIGADIKSLTTSVSTNTSAISTIQTDLTTNHKWVQLTQAAYDALGTKDANTLYVIVG